MLTLVSLMRLILNYLVVDCWDGAEVDKMSFFIRWTSGFVMIWSTKLSKELGGCRLGRYAG